MTLSDNEHSQAINALCTYLKNHNIDSKAFKKKYPFWWLPEQRKEYVRMIYWAQQDNPETNIMDNIIFSEKEQRFFEFYKGIVDYIFNYPERLRWTSIKKLGDLLSPEINSCLNSDELYPSLPTFFSLIIGRVFATASDLSQLNWHITKAMETIKDEDSNSRKKFISSVNYPISRNWYINNEKYDMAIFKDISEKKPFLLINFIYQAHIRQSEPLLLAQNNKISYLELMYHQSKKEFCVPGQVICYSPTWTTKKHQQNQQYYH